MDLTTSATGPDGNTNEQRPNLVPGQALIWPVGISTPRLFALPGLQTRFTRVVSAPLELASQVSAMSRAISCEVPGPGKWI